LSAQNSFGTVQGATYSFTTTTNPPPAGSAPTVSTNAAGPVTRTTAVLNGHVDPKNAQTTYWFEYGPTQSFGNTSGFGAAGSGTDSIAVSIPIDSLNPQTTYYYRLNAQNNYGMVSGATESFSTPGPVATGLPTVNATAATNVSTSSATLNGRINPHNAASTYWFEYGTSPLLNPILGTVSATQTLPGEATTNVSVGVSGLATNTKYYYRLIARNPEGMVVSDSTSFTTKR
jgi:phosphodiesterase/alkaline phosphatase D-like protein